jgi:hypothetical protein
MRHTRRMFLAALVVFSVAATACPKNTAQKLATASDAFAHSLRAAQQAVQLGVQDGTISAAENTAIEPFFVKVATAGKALDGVIRSNASNSSVAAALQGVIVAMAGLTTQGVVGIKNQQRQQEIAVALNGAAAAVAIVAATVGAPVAAPPAPPLKVQ